MYKKDQMAIVNSTIKSVERKVGRVGGYIPFVYFSFNNFTIDTRKSNKSAGYIVSFSNKKNGSGKANSFEIVIAYAPSMDPNVSGDIDIELIDKSLLYKSAKDRTCTIKYGYNIGPDVVETPYYQAMIMKYTIEMRSGILYYTITGFSGVVSDIELTRNFTGSSVETNPIDYVINTLKDVFGTRYNIESDISDKDMPINTVIQGDNDTNIFAHISNVLGSAVKDGEGNLPKNERTIYSYIISDIPKNGKSGTIYIVSDSINGDNNEQNATIVFDWGRTSSKSTGPNATGYASNMVLDFQVDFNGQIPLAFNILTDEDAKRYGIDQEGNIVSVDLLNQLPTTIDANIDTITESDKGKNIKETALEIRTWIQAIQYSYTATLRTIGIPTDIPIGGYFKIVPTIQGKKHSTAGIYMVLNSEDTIDSNGFETTMKLMKVTNEKVVNSFSEYSI